MSLTLVAERLAVELSLPVLTSMVYRGRILNNQPIGCEANVLSDCALAATVSAYMSLSISVSDNSIDHDTSH